MGRKSRMRGFSLMAGALVVSGPVLAACQSGPSYEAWAATDGAAGRINLDQVQEAFQKSESATDFEREVNQIYEGDGLVIIRAKQDGDRLTLEGYEDLDSSGSIDDASDDLLFSIVKDEDDQHEMRGHGANGYYNNSFGGGNFLFTYLLLSSFNRGPYFYRTDPARTSTLRNQRTNYRTSPAYRSQVSRNSSYFTRQKGFAGSSYDSAGRNLSGQRQSYLSTRRTSGSFRTSSTGVRSSFGSRSSVSRSSSGGRSSFGGFGGSQVVIGVKRG